MINTITDVKLEDNEFVVLTHEKDYPLMNLPHRAFIPLTIDEAEELVMKIQNALKDRRN